MQNGVAVLPLQGRDIKTDLSQGQTLFTEQVRIYKYSYYRTYL